MIRVLLAASCLALLLFPGCDDGTPAGTERGPCYPNGTCNAGLACRSDLCVRLGDGDVIDAGVDMLSPPADGSKDSAKDDMAKDDGSGPDAGDTTAPEVVLSDPADGATGVDTNATITVVFSEAMDPASLDGASFKVSAGGQALSGTVNTAGSSASFVPDLPLAQQTPHAVTITTGAKDLAGNALDKAHAFSFVTRQRGWGTAEQLEIGSPTAEVPAVAMDASGNAMAVWSQFAGFSFSIWAAPFSVAADAWDPGKLAESNDQGNASAPSVAMDASGNAVVAFWQFDGAKYNIWANRYQAGAKTWGTPQLLETGDGDASAPAVAVDASGNALVVFWQHDGSRFSIMANRFVASSGTWATAELLETSDVGDASDPQVAINAAGDGVAVFWLHDGSRFSAWANRFSAKTGTWAGAEQLEANDGQDVADPQVAIDAAGNAVATWLQHDGTRYSVWSNRLSAGVGWGTAELLESQPGNAQDPRVAVDEAGNATVVWRQRDSADKRFDLWARRYEASGKTWGGATLVESNDQGSAGVPSVAVDRDGNALVGWAHGDGTRFAVWANRYSVKTNAWANAVLIESSNTGNAKGVRLAMDPDGSATAVWAQYDGTRFDIWANRFD